MDPDDFLNSSDEDLEDDYSLPKPRSKGRSKGYSSKREKEDDLSLRINEQQATIDDLERGIREKQWKITKLEHEKTEAIRKLESKGRRVQDRMSEMERKYSRQVSSLKARLVLLDNSNKGREEEIVEKDDSFDRSKYEDLIRKQKRQIKQLENQIVNYSEIGNTNPRVLNLEKEIEMMKLTFSTETGLVEFINNEAEELSSSLRKRQNKKPSKKERISTLLTREKRYKKMKKMIQKYSRDFLRHSEIVTNLKDRIIDLSTLKIDNTSLKEDNAKIKSQTDLFRKKINLYSHKLRNTQNTNKKQEQEINRLRERVKFLEKDGGRSRKNSQKLKKNVKDIAKKYDSEIKVKKDYILKHESLLKQFKEKASELETSKTKFLKLKVLYIRSKEEMIRKNKQIDDLTQKNMKKFMASPKKTRNIINSTTTPQKNKEKEELEKLKMKLKNQESSISQKFMNQIADLTTQLSKTKEELLKLQKANTFSATLSFLKIT